MLVGCARISTADQQAGLVAQERDPRGAGAEKLLIEEVSSVVQRGGLRACLEFIRDGDALVVTKPDRLARSTAELLAIEADLSRRGIGLLVLSMGGERLDTRNPISKLMPTILGGVAAWEREIMLERQREGIAKAKADGNIKGASRPSRFRLGKSARCMRPVRNRRISPRASAWRGAVSTGCWTADMSLIMRLLSLAPARRRTSDDRAPRNERPNTTGDC